MQTAKETNEILNRARELAKDPIKQAAMQAGWNKVLDQLQPYYLAMRPMPKSFEVHHMNEHARYHFMVAYVNGNEMEVCIDRAVSKVKG